MSPSCPCPSSVLQQQRPCREKGHQEQNLHRYKSSECGSFPLGAWGFSTTLQTSWLGMVNCQMLGMAEPWAVSVCSCDKSGTLLEGLCMSENECCLPEVLYKHRMNNCYSMGSVKGLLDTAVICQDICYWLVGNSSWPLRRAGLSPFLFYSPLGFIQCPLSSPVPAGLPISVHPCHSALALWPLRPALVPLQCQSLDPEPFVVFNVSQTPRGTNVCFPWPVFNACTTDLGLVTEGKDSWEGRSHRREGRLPRNTEWHKAGGEAVASPPAQPRHGGGQSWPGSIALFLTCRPRHQQDKAWAQGDQEAPKETSGECVCKGHTPVTRGSWTICTDREVKPLPLSVICTISNLSNKLGGHFCSTVPKRLSPGWDVMPWRCCPEQTYVPALLSTPGLALPQAPHLPYQLEQL